MAVTMVTTMAMATMVGITMVVITIVGDATMVAATTPDMVAMDIATTTTTIMVAGAIMEAITEMALIHATTLLNWFINIKG